MVGNPEGATNTYYAGTHTSVSNLGIDKSDAMPAFIDGTGHISFNAAVGDGGGWTP